MHSTPTNLPQRGSSRWAARAGGASGTTIARSPTRNNTKTPDGRHREHRCHSEKSTNPAELHFVNLINHTHFLVVRGIQPNTISPMSWVMASSCSIRASSCVHICDHFGFSESVAVLFIRFVLLYHLYACCSICLNLLIAQFTPRPYQQAAGL